MAAQRAYLARHLRNASLHMMQAGQTLCRETGTDLQPTWASLIMSLEDGSSLTVTEAAERLGTSHVHARNILKAMHKSGTVDAAKDPDDGRSTRYTLTGTGRAHLPFLHSVKNASEAAIDALTQELGFDIHAAINALNTALHHQSWESRLRQNLDSTQK